MDTRGFELGCDGPSVVVVGVDGSDTSWRAVYYAFGLARRQRSTVVAVFALAAALAPDGTPLVAPGDDRDPGGELRSEISALAAEHRVCTEFVCVTGEPVLALTTLAAERRADALVVGASQALAHRFFGSKALRAVRRSRCPVTVVP